MKTNKIKARVNKDGLMGSASKTHRVKKGKGSYRRRAKHQKKIWKKCLCALDKQANLCDIKNMNNDEINWNEENQTALLDNLLDKVCQGVNVPSDDEAEEAFHQQH